MTENEIVEMRRFLTDFEFRAEEASDERRLKLVRSFRELAGRMEDENARQRLEQFGEGAQLARELDESWMELLFLHGRLLARMELDEYQGALEEATRGVVLLSRAPDYLLRACTFHDLVAIYQAVDACGYGEQIESALENIQRELRPDDSCAGCVRSCRVQQHLARKSIDEAHDEIMGVLEQLARESSAAEELLDRDEQRLATRRRRRSRRTYYLKLCSLAFARRDWNQLQRWCDAVRECLEDARPTTIAEARMWQAILARHEGRDDEALRLERLARRYRQRSRLLPSTQFWDAWSGFHELSGNLARALRVRRQQQRAISGRGMLGDECLCTIEIARLKQRLGRDFREDCDRVRRFSATLPRPELYLDQLPVPASRLRSSG